MCYNTTKAPAPLGQGKQGPLQWAGREESAMLQTLYTPQGEALTGTPWQVYPRPQLRREGWLNLNGDWEFALSDDADLPAAWPMTIRVPFCPESLLSGIGKHFDEGSWLFYRRRFSLPAGFAKDRVLLHIGAADQFLDCFVNGQPVGSHAGGYEAMTFDITEALLPENTLVLRVRDDLRSHVQPYGKQVMERGGMWYTPVSGVWQTVWLESVPRPYIRKLDIRTDTRRAVIDTGDDSLEGTVTVDAPEGQLTVPLQKGKAVVEPLSPRLWSPEDPFLYPFTVKTATDRVESYFALRQISVRKIDGHARLCLNGKPYFFHGVLDQGYYSDGLFTPAAPECFEKDILAMKKLGFNTLRKHIKVEPEEYYYQCDRLGMVVFQDMVSNGDYDYIRDTVLPTVGLQRRRDKQMHRDAETRAAFLAGMKATVNQLKSHPCILCWTIFNEGWGQFDSSAAYHTLRSLDDSRIINTVSGWFRGGESDLDSRHIYFGPWRLKAGKKPLVLTEFGGCCLAVKGHIFNPDKAYGYSTAETPADLQRAILRLYTRYVLPAAEKGLCAAIYTQLSDVEDEINGLVTYDRRVEKLAPGPMAALAARLQRAVQPRQQND